MSRIRLTDPDSIRCFLKEMVASTGRIRITKAGKVSITGDVRVIGTNYSIFLREYNQLRLQKPKLPELSGTFDYFPVHFEKVSNVLTIEYAEHLVDFEGLPAVTTLFLVTDAPNIRTCQFAPRAWQYAFKNLELASLNGLAAEWLVRLENCKVTSLDDMPATVSVLSILGEDPIEQGKTLDNIKRVIIQQRNSVSVNWDLFPNLKELAMDTTCQQPDSATLRRWLTTPNFHFAGLRPLSLFKPTFSGTPIQPSVEDPVLPVWQQLLNHVTKFPGDMLSIVSGFQELYGEPLFPTNTIAAPDPVAAAFDAPLV